MAKMTDPIRPVVDIIGDSHTMFFKADFNSVRRMGVNTRLAFVPRVQQVNAASLTGVRRYASTLRLKELIETTAANASHLIIALGQVDLELGFYYRQAVKGEEWAPADYIEFLAEIYAGLLDGIRGAPCKVALKGVNLTVLSTPLFSRKYLSRILTEKAPEEREAAEKKLRELVLNERQQNGFHLDFNRRINALADQFGIRYFDINEKIAERGPAGRIRQPMRLATGHQPIRFDHHLAPTIHVHRVHLDAVQTVFL